MAEKGRLLHTENTLRKFCKLEKEALEARLRLLNALEVHVSDIYLPTFQ
jgi:hypothetical protein